MTIFYQTINHKWDELLLGEFWRCKEVHFERLRFQMSRPYYGVLHLQLRFFGVMALEDPGFDWNSSFSISHFFCINLLFLGTVLQMQIIHDN